MTRAAACALALGWCALGCGAGDDAPPPTVGADARALAAILDSDPTGPALDDAMQAVDTGRPVMAAGILSADAIPAARRQLERMEQLHAASSDGRSLYLRAMRVQRARVAALEHYRDALARGPVEDDVLLDALHETSTSERDLLALRQDLVEHAPLPERAIDPSAGLPPIGEATGDVVDTTEEPVEVVDDQVVDDPGRLDDALPEM
jgi:hypothetical protein